MPGLKRTLQVAASLAAFVVACVYVDLNLRARSAYLEGERYFAWHGDAQAKKAFFDAEYEAEKKELEKKRASSRMSAEEAEQLLELAAFRRDEAVAESSLKYAYHWHKTAVELFSPPESRWVKMSRARMAEAKALWMSELDAKGIPYESTMLE